MRQSRLASSHAKLAAQLAALFFALLLCLGAGDESLRFNSIGHRIMCVCGCNQILLECNHVGCPYSDRMRNELLAGIERGDNDDLILQAFVQKYGTTVIAAPTNTGFNRVAWIMPYFALMAGIGVAILIIRTWRSQPVAPAAYVTPLTAEELERYRQQARKDTEDS